MNLIKSIEAGFYLNTTEKKVKIRKKEMNYTKTYKQ